MDNEIHTENYITKSLDESLKNKSNIKISGPTGCGKTAIVKSWAKHNEDKINSFYFDCTLLADASGKEINFRDLTLTGELFDEETIDAISSKTNLVVVFDNYHFASRNVKSHILLLCDRYIVDSRCESGLRKLDNIEFVCTINTTKY